MNSRESSRHTLLVPLKVSIRIVDRPRYSGPTFDVTLTLNLWLKATLSTCSITPVFQKASWFAGVTIPPLTRNNWSMTNKPQIFLSRRAIVQCGIGSSVSCSWFASARSFVNFFAQPVSRKCDWFEALSRRRFANKDRQSSTTSEPCDREPSASINEKIKSKAFSKATSFCSSSEPGVNAISRSMASTKKAES